MSRRSSMGAAAAAAGIPDDDSIKRASEFLGYEPTPGQRVVKAAFWAAWRDDPSVDPARLTAADVGKYVDAPSIDKWWRDSGFRDWFLNKEEWRAKAEAATGLWLDQIYRRLASGMMSDKDLVGVGKLLTEVTNKIPRATDPKQKQLGMTEAEARAVLEAAGRQLGWQPPAALPAPGDADE